MSTTPDEPQAGDGIPSFSDIAREVLRELPDVALFVFDAELRFVFCDGGSLVLAGRDPLALEGSTLRDALGPDADLVEPIYRSALAGETVDVELAVNDREFSIRAAPRHDREGRIVGGSLLSVDVTVKRRAERAAREGVERVERIASNVPGVVYRVHVAPDGRVSYPYVSNGIRGILGIDPTELQDDPALLLRLIHPDDLPDFRQAMVAVAGSESPSLWEGRIVRPDGDVRWLRIASRPRCGDVDGTIRDGVAIDVTEQHLAEETARWRLHHDVLTGLPNRALYSDRLEEALARTRRTGAAVGVAFVDLDSFKRINDTFGHAVGDEVLRVIARRVGSRLRPCDTVARHGGDELTVLLPGLTDREHAIELAARVAAACAEPVVIGDRRMTVGCSIGLAIAPDDGLDAGRLLNRADAALYRAKQRGRGRVEVFDDDLARETERRAFLEGRLRAAIERGELHVAYQRQVDACGAEVGFEALARWQPEGGEAVPPSVFVPLAEELGLISELGAFMLREACAQAALWYAAGEPRRIAVNVAPAQLADPRLNVVVAETLAATGLPPGLLELELTESALIDTDSGAATRLAELRRLGVRIALDDFGTGYSSLARLRRIPLDVLKIDESFVAEIGDGAGTSIVRAVIELAHTLGLEVVAEGIETEEQRRVIAGLGGDRLQGYLLGRPGPAPGFASDEAERPEAA